MTLPTPPSSLDKAAVEAQNHLAGRHMLASPFTDGPAVARIITDAYAEQHRRHPVPYESERDMLQESVNHQDKQLDTLNARLTAERAVRDKLVKGLGDIAEMENATEIRLPAPFCGLGCKLTEDGYELISSSMRLGFKHAAKCARVALAEAVKLDEQ